MSAETKPVDVLSVLDDAISDYCDRAFTDRGGVGPELIKARAAVAELIEASGYMDCPAYSGPDRDCLRAALASCGVSK